MTPITAPTLLVPALFIPDLPADKWAAVEVWSGVYWEARRCADVLSRNLDIQMPTHFNPEYFLGAWTDTILDKELFRQDVLGWALNALVLEQEHLLGRPPHPDEMLNESQCFDFLARFKDWAEARLAYHRIALLLTFYKADPFADQEPIASDVDRLRARLKDWRDVQLTKRERLFESDPKIGPWLRSLQDVEHFRKEEVRALEFKQWLHKNGLKKGVITGQRTDWLCWLCLIAPISRDWRPNEMAMAVCKTFGDPDYREAAKDWWDEPPSGLTYLPVEKDDDFVKTVTKRIFPQEFLDWKAERDARTICGRGRLSDLLRKELKELGIEFRADARGRSKNAKDELPSLPDVLRGEAEPELDTTGDSEKDEPKGWLLANSLNP